ncbi:hypothetical protein [Campylobacter sp. MG1]|uniref:hypothetical protein n=1 Tax=Campylobacter sp. MG1 TaxID=2976332 RepID=UPI00226D2627|nr:hypothetical protein [Campylobacter sp. MG1]
MLDYFIVFILICVCIFFIVMMFYYKALFLREKNIKENLENNIIDMEELIKKLQTHFKSSLENIDLLDSEIIKLKNEIINLRIRNSKYRLENDKLKSKSEEINDIS